MAVCAAGSGSERNQSSDKASAAEHLAPTPQWHPKPDVHIISHASTAFHALSYNASCTLKRSFQSAAYTEYPTYTECLGVAAELMLKCMSHSAQQCE